MSAAIAGVLAVLQTPFDEHGTIDWISLEREVDYVFETGAQGICTGMVSELLRLTADERRELTARLADLNNDRGVFIAGIGAESTQQALEFGRQAAAAGAHAVMAIPPVSTKLPPDKVRSYFQVLARELPIPVIVQDASSYVGQQIPISVCEELLNEFGPERILFKPEAAPLGPNLSILRDATFGKARIFEGSGGTSLVDSFRRGIAGTMPGVDLLPSIVALWKALQQSDDNAIYRIYFPVCALVALQLQAGLDGFLAIEKYILKKRGLFATDVRREPYAWSLDEETRQEVDRLLNRLSE